MVSLITNHSTTSTVTINCKISLLFIIKFSLAGISLAIIMCSVNNEHPSIKLHTPRKTWMLIIGFYYGYKETLVGVVGKASGDGK